MNEYERLGRLVVEKHNTPHTADYKKWSELLDLEMALIRKLAKEQKEQNERTKVN